MPNDHDIGVPPAPDQGMTPAGPCGAQAQQAALTILVVDDDRVLAQLLADGLAAMGHDAIVAQSANEAWQVLQDRDDIGVVVSDIRMPGNTGLDLARNVVAQLEDARAAAVVLITGHATAEDAAAGMRLGAAEFLRKPFRLGDLIGAVETALEKARRRRRGAAKRAEKTIRSD